MKVVVVGAGISGLYCADRLRRRGVPVTVLEARPRVGGRVRSARDRRGRMLYECGPWRIPEEHKDVIALCKRLGIRLVPLRTPPVEPPDDPGVVRGLSIWDVHALRSRSVAEADLRDAATGYAGQTAAASGSSPYTATGSRRFFVAPEGFDRITDALAEAVEDLRLDTRVHELTRDDARGDYVLKTVERRDGRLRPGETLRADAVFVCVPPSQCCEWSALRAHARPVLDAVEPGSLNHVYARGSIGGVHERSATGLLQQTIGDQYGRGWFQASYSAGRVAEFWFRLFLAGGTAAYSLLKRLLGWAPGEIRVHFWREAYHRWRPAPAFDLPRAVRKAVRPHPLRLPDLYLCGEAFSSYQAWMQGGVETARMATDLFLKRDRVQTRPKGRDELCVDGRLVDVAAFQAVHPGGRVAIARHLVDEDVGPLMRHVGHSEVANSAVLHMQTGWKS